ncbi:hypothetical protein [Pseudonocardia xishanensis]|uniref:3-carboxy-cis,cis-muconate cycloisomerase n=1 Tax=Pseudonocardia xishanensis TaxID=630995 RepID=A0ABP8RYQ3_9PSEU
MTSIPVQATSPDELLGALRGTPFHEWATLRRLASDAATAQFDTAASRVRQEWSADELRSQLRQALTAAAAACVQAMADLDAPPAVGHLLGAEEALRAAAQLRTGPLAL